MTERVRVPEEGCKTIEITPHTDGQANGEREMVNVRERERERNNEMVERGRSG